MLSTRNRQGGDTIIAFAVLHVFSFSMFWGPTPWVYLGESFPLRVRPKAIALGSATSRSKLYIVQVRADNGFDYRLDLELPSFILLPADLQRHRTTYPAHFLRHVHLRLVLCLLLYPRDQRPQPRRGR
jgi:hypothetical protein